MPFSATVLESKECHNATMKVDLFILNYNGLHFVGDCIQSFLEATKNSSHQCRVVVIDNQSKDGSPDLIKNKFPQVHLMAMSQNRVLCSFNDAAKQSDADILFLLNNDLKTDPYSIDPMVSIFLKQDDAFLVTAKSLLFDGSYEGGLSIPLFSSGMFFTTCLFPGYEKLKEQAGITFAAGFGAFHRKRFLELGGYDDLYLPGRVEDSDLMLRAWKKGWKCYYQPKSIFYHMGGKTFKHKYGERGTMEIAHKNTFLFTWKNISDPIYLLEHFFFLIPRMIWMLLKGRWEFTTAFLKALGKLHLIAERRRKEKKVVYLYSDRQIIELFAHEH